MSGRDFKQAIAAAKAELGRVEMPTHAAHRVLRNVTRGRRSPGLVVASLVLACAGAGAVLVIAHGRPSAPPAAGVVAAARLPAGFQTVGATADLQLDVAGAGTSIGVRRGSCSLRVQGWGRVTLRAGASFRPVDGGVELALGEADFEVEKRSPGSRSTFVRGPQGTIEITGTRFTVAQRPDGGTVRLDEGAIRFHAPDGRTVVLAPGESLAWPLPAPLSSPSSSPPSSINGMRAAAPARRVFVSAKIGRALGRELQDQTPTGSVDPTETVDGTAALVGRISALRAAGRYDELARELRAALVRELRPLTRERLSFELGSVLSYHLPDRAAACAHWEAHRRSFPPGRYAQEISDVESALSCRSLGGHP